MQYPDVLLSQLHYIFLQKTPQTIIVIIIISQLLIACPQYEINRYINY